MHSYATRVLPLNDKGKNMCKRLFAGIVLGFLAVAGARAETVYVTDKMYIALRAGPTKDALSVKTIASGATLEVLERQEKYARVRDAEGVEGWLDALYLVSEPPARAQLLALQAQVAQLQGALTQETAKTADLSAKLAGGLPAEDAETWYSPGWLAVSFAMLVIGFLAGMQWLRETYRRRLGGMYLKI